MRKTKNNTNCSTQNEKKIIQIYFYKYKYYS